VGKFITQSNDYFFPAAAPIIYAFFLLTVLIYFRAKDAPDMDIRGELYTVLEILQEVLDHDVDPHEHDEMKHRLDNIIKKTTNENYKRLATELEDFVDSDALKPVKDEENIFDRFIDTWTRFEDAYLTETRFRAALIIVLVLLGLPSFMRFMSFASVARHVDQRALFIENLAASFPSASGNIEMWTTMLVVFDGLAGAILSIGAILMIIERRNWSIQLTSLSLIVSLVAINLVLFYVEQFQTIVVAMVQYIALQSIYYYQRKYVKKGQPLSAG
jgi:hypothetical protein